MNGNFLALSQYRLKELYAFGGSDVVRFSGVVASSTGSIGFKGYGAFC